MKSEEGEMSNLQRKEKQSHSPNTHDLSVQIILLWNMQMKFLPYNSGKKHHW